MHLSMQTMEVEQKIAMAGINDDKTNKSQKSNYYASECAVVCFVVFLARVWKSL